MESPLLALRNHFDLVTRENDAMAQFASLVTIDFDSQPASRMVTVRSIDSEKITIHLNKKSPKAQQLISNGKYELLFFWPSLLIQYRVRGTFELQSDAQLAKDWLSKPRASKIADIYHSAGRPQSSIVESYGCLQDEVKNLDAKISETDLEMPATVSRLVLFPTFIEGWIGSPEDRIHRRTTYVLKEGKWRGESLVP